ncbi:MAG: hypothetical protein A4E58_00436 [Syntrophorhabdus sp. PtaB.Bin006]|nr:MAG: hypothetical protein A4E58_00436 [Syntrophorhabdus sp. PtaB.Bin006]
MRMKLLNASLLAVVLVGVFCVPGLPEETTSYFYDNLGRLIRIQYSDRAQQYTYDKVGNRETRGVQEGMCAYSIWPPSKSFSESGGNSTISVTAGTSCPWTAAADESWITITSGTSGTGNGTVAYTVAETGLPPRQGSISVAWQSVIINQVQSPDVTPPVGSISIDSGATYTNNVNVGLHLSCTDNMGCLSMRFSNDNVTYSSPEIYGTSKAWTLTGGSGLKTVYVQFVDEAGNSTVYSGTIVLNATCTNPNVRIGTTSYATLQAAYNAAVTGDVIKCQGVKLTDSLTTDRNITVTVDGGYDCSFTANTGIMTVVKGMITAAQGSTTLRNITLETQ